MSAATTYLRLGYGTSRGRDTYGYNIVRLTDETSGRTFRCMGGGYDMVGTVLAEWAQETHQDRLLALADRAFYVSPVDGPYRRTDDESSAFYGMTRHEYGDAVPVAPTRVTLDGACGVESILRILKAAGLSLTRTYKTSGRNRGETTGWLVEVSQ